MITEDSRPSAAHIFRDHEKTPARPALAGGGVPDA
jgi:hypothetical protein